jgi:hypothetical protein
MDLIDLIPIVFYSTILLSAFVYLAFIELSSRYY